MSALNRHCSEALFEDYFCGIMPESDAAELAAHLISCSLCRDRAEQISDALLRTNTWLRDTRRQVDSYVTFTEDKFTQGSVVEPAPMEPAAMSGLSDIGSIPTKLQEKPFTRQWSLENWLRWRRGYKAFARVPQYALAVAAIAICAFAWWSHIYIRKLSSSNVTLSRAVQSLTKDNDVLSQKNAVLNQQLNQVIASQQNQRHVEVSLRSLSKWVNDLVTNGEVKPTERVQLAMAALSTPITRGEPTSTEERTALPLAPVRTGIRTTTPTLRWQTVPGAVQYSVVLEYAETENDGKVVWEGSADAQDHVNVPRNLLKEGHSYLWQVKARVGQHLRLSPTVGFWVIDPESLREVEVGEREYQGSALVLAALYERHGLYEEALGEIERLNKASPRSPAVREMLRTLRDKLRKGDEGS